MIIKEFIDSIALTIIDKFEGIELAYEYEPISDTHFFVISPPELLKDKTFNSLELCFIDRFIDYGFSGAICFITDKDEVNLEAPTKLSFSSQTHNYKDILLKKDNMTWDISFKKNGIDDSKFSENSFSMAA